MPEREKLKLKFVLQRNLGGFMFVFHSNFSIACYCILQNLSVDVWSEKEKKVSSQQHLFSVGMRVPDSRRLLARIKHINS